MPILWGGVPLLSLSSSTQMQNRSSLLRSSGDLNITLIATLVGEHGDVVPEQNWDQKHAMQNAEHDGSEAKLEENSEHGTAIEEKS